MREILHYEDYESITDTIFSCSNIVLKFSVRLSYKGTDDKRKLYYRECTYNSSKYNQPLTSIQRKISSYLILENVKPNENGEKESIIMTYQDMYHVKNKFTEMSNVLMNAYQYNSNNKLELNGVYDPVCIFAGGKHIEMIPIILNYDSTQVRGVRLTLQSCDNFIDITIDQFSALKYILENMDIYGYTLSILAFLGRPEFGTNNFTVGGNNNNSPFK